MSSSAPKRRVSYFIPPPAGPLPRLELPPEGVHRNGATGPLLIPSKAAEGGGLYTPTTPTFTRERQPRHRLGVASLALDSATQLLGRPTPGGILYTGGRDGQVLAWDLGLPYRQRSRTHGINSEGANRRWEMLTGWGDDVYEDEDEEEDVPLAGDILGDVPVKRKRRGSRPDDPIPYEEQWELELEDNPRIQVSVRETTRA
jgi:WD repeat-containing protein 48